MTTSAEKRQYTLDPVTFEVLKNAFVTIVDQMAEQILRTCYSFVIYARDFSSALCDRDGNTIMQGSQDIAVHVGTLHFTCKAVIEAFEGDIHPGDVFAVNDPYVGGTHFNDVRIVRPIFYEDEIIAYAQSNGHWADVGGSVPGLVRRDREGALPEGIRIPPVRIWDQGRYLGDVVRLIVSNTRVPADAEGDLHAQASATTVAEGEILRLVEKYGIDTVTTAFQEVQDYVERLTRQRVAEMPDGTWETEDYIDYDPSKGEGLIPVKVKMTIEGDQLSYDLTGSHPAIGSFINAGFGSAFSGVIAGTKTFFPDVPLNSGFYRAVEVDLGPVGSVVNAPWPIAVTGFCAGPYEKIMNSIFELWSRPAARARPRLLVQPRVPAGRRPRRALRETTDLHVVRLDGRRLGRPERQGRLERDRADLRRRARGAAARGAGAAVPGADDRPRDPDRLGRPGQVPRRLRRREGRRSCARRSATVMSYMCDRARSITWGIEGGLPSIPHGVWLTRDGEESFLGAVFSNVACRLRRPVHAPVGGRRRVRRPARARHGGGARGRGGRVRLARARAQGLRRRRAGGRRRARRVRDRRGGDVGGAGADPLASASAGSTRSRSRSPQRYRAGEIDQLDVIRRHGVILDWGTGELLPRTTDAVPGDAAAAHGRPLGLRRMVRVAAVQAAPVFLDRDATVEKAVRTDRGGRGGRRAARRLSRDVDSRLPGLDLRRGGLGRRRAEARLRAAERECGRGAEPGGRRRSARRRRRPVSSSRWG